MYIFGDMGVGGRVHVGITPQSYRSAPHPPQWAKTGVDPLPIYHISDVYGT